MTKKKTGCTCGEPSTLGTVHRSDAPCRELSPLAERMGYVMVPGFGPVHVSVVRAVEDAHGIGK